MKKTDFEKNIETLISKVEHVNGLTVDDLRGYSWLVKANDKFLSGWGGSGESGHCQLVLCRDRQQALKCVDRMGAVGSGFSHITSTPIAYGKIYPTPKKSHNLNLIDNCPIWK